MKKKSPRFLLIMILFLLVACSRQARREDFVVAFESFPSNVDPRHPIDAYSVKISQLIFNGLVKFDEQLQLLPDLAESYEYLSPTKLRFHLRKGIRFHNGKELTTADVLYTFKTIMDPATSSPLNGNFKRISELSAVDDYTLEIELKEPFAPFLTVLTVGIIPVGADEGNLPFSRHPIGTGPFRWVDYREDQWVRLEAFPDYYEGAPLLNSLLVKTVRDDTTRVLQLLHGEIDLVQNAIPLIMASWLQEKAHLPMESDPGINYVYMAFNFKDPLFQNRLVREAFARAIDRDSLIQYRLKGFARKATGIIPPSSFYYENNVDQYGYDPERAKQLLDEAGFVDPDGDGPTPRMQVILKTSTKRDRVAMARALAADLSKVGIDVQVRPYEWGTFFRDIKSGNFQIFVSTWVGVTDPDILYDCFDSKMFPPEGKNRGYYFNPELDALLERARQLTDLEERKVLYSKAQKIIAGDLPYVSLWYEDNVVFTQPGIEGYRLRPDASLIGLAKTAWNRSPREIPHAER